MFVKYTNASLQKSSQYNDTNLTLVNINFHKNSFRILLCQLLKDRCNSLTRTTPKNKKNVSSYIKL